MANTLTAKLTITDANGVIPGATASAGINFSFDYTQATRQEVVVANAATKTISLGVSPGMVVVVPLDGIFTCKAGTAGSPTQFSVQFDAADGGAIMIGAPGGMAVDEYEFTENGGGAASATLVIYSWTP